MEEEHKKQQKEQQKKDKSKKYKKSISINISIIMIIIVIVIAVGVITILYQNKEEEVENIQYHDNLVHDSIVTEDERYSQIPTEELKIEAERKSESQEFYEEKEKDGLIFKNILYIQTGEIVVFEADVVNQTGKNLPDTEKEITLIDEEGKEICTFGIYIDAVENGKARRIHAQIEQGYFTELDILTARDFTIK